jgi:hypothetical protein
MNLQILELNSMLVKAAVARFDPAFDNFGPVSSAVFLQANTSPQYEVPRVVSIVSDFF